MPLTLRCNLAIRVTCGFKWAKIVPIRHDGAGRMVHLLRYLAAAAAAPSHRIWDYNITRADTPTFPRIISVQIKLRHESQQHSRSSCPPASSPKLLQKGKIINEAHRIGYHTTTPHPLVMFSCSSFGTLPCELVIAKSRGTIDNEEKKDTKQGNIPQPRHVHTEFLYMLFVLLTLNIL